MAYNGGGRGVPNRFGGSVSSYGGMSAKRGGILGFGVYNDGDFTAEQIAEFREVFNWFDKNHDEYINEIELGNAMRALGENPTQAELSELLKTINSTKSSSYSATNSPYNGPTRHTINGSFSMSTSEMPDLNGKSPIPHNRMFKQTSGGNEELKVPDQDDSMLYRVAQYKIDFSQFLIMMAHKMQSPDDEKEIRDAFKIFDTNDNGKIDKDKFMKAMITVGEPLTKREVTQLFTQISGDKNAKTIDYEDFMSFMLNDQ